MRTRGLQDRTGLKSFVVFGGVLAFLDLVSVPIIASLRPGPRDLLIPLFLALLAAQVSLVATWGVFGTVRFPIRLIWCAALGFAAYLCTVAGVLTAARHQEGLADFVRAMLALLFCLPLVFFCVQLPLLAGRLWLGWSVRGPAVRTAGFRVTLRHIFLAFAAGSVALALARIGQLVAPEMPPGEFLVFLAVLATAAAGASLFTLPPILVLALAPHPVLVGLVGAALWSALLTAGGILVAWLALGSQLTPSQTTGLATAVITHAALVFFGLWLTRDRGYRLQWRQLR